MAQIYSRLLRKWIDEPSGPPSGEEPEAFRALKRMAPPRRASAARLPVIADSNAPAPAPQPGRLPPVRYSLKFKRGADGKIDGDQGVTLERLGE